MDCPRTILTERLPGIVAPYARRTVRLTRLVELVGMLLGGKAGSRLLDSLGTGHGCSHDAVLRVVRQASLEAIQVLSVDDFALHRGVTYGTILLDLEHHHVIDLLPERSDVVFAQWLRQHPEVRLVSRDRGGDYAAAVRTSAPQAEQIADRFHLVVNAGEVVERYLKREPLRLHEAARTLGPPDAPRRTPKRTPAYVQHQRERRAARLARYEQVIALAHEGVSAHQITQEVGVSRATVYRFLTATGSPERLSPRRPRQIAPYVPYLQDHWNAGEHNALALWRAIHAQGYPAGVAQVRRVVAGWRTPAPAPGVPGTPLPAKREAISYSARQTHWLLTKAEADLSGREAAYLTALKQRCPQISEAQRLLTTCSTLVSDRASARLAPWLEQCDRSGIPEFVRFARGLRRDYAAVGAALRYPWSQGPIEGHIHRLKLLKRQMYGRASFDLLRQRVLFQPPR